MIWNATPNGKFLVRSAYKLAMDKLREAVALMMGQYKKKKKKLEEDMELTSS